jgi:outer membrane receptor protein involved in Fe transport
LSQLYSEDKGNPDLQPEKSINVDAGAEYVLLKGIHTRAVFFNEEFRNMISRPALITSRYKNVGRACSRGIECGFDLDVEKMKKLFSLDYVYTATYDFEEKGALPYVPLHTIGSRLSFPFLKGGNARLAAQWTGSRTGENARSVYDPYFLLNGSVSYSWKFITAGFFIDNIFDADYATEDPVYPMPGRTLRGMMTVEFSGTLFRSAEKINKGEK